MRFTGRGTDEVIDEEDALLKDTTLPEGTVATYSCERGFELLGPARRECQAEGVWMPEGVPFCGESLLHFSIVIISKYKLLTIGNIAMYDKLSLKCLIDTLISAKNKS